MQAIGWVWDVASPPGLIGSLLVWTESGAWDAVATGALLLAACLFSLRRTH